MLAKMVLPSSETTSNASPMMCVLKSLGFGDFRHRSADRRSLANTIVSMTWQMFPALVGDEPDIIVGIDLDCVHVFDATYLLLVGAVEQIPAVVHGELRREVTAVSATHTCGHPPTDNPRPASHLIAAITRILSPGLCPPQKLVDHHDVDVDGVGDHSSKFCGTCGTLPVATNTRSGAR